MEDITRTIMIKVQIMRGKFLAKCIYYEKRNVIILNERFNNGIKFN